MSESLLVSYQEYSAIFRYDYVGETIKMILFIMKSPNNFMSICPLMMFIIVPLAIYLYVMTAVKEAMHM